MVGSDVTIECNPVTFDRGTLVCPGCCVAKISATERTERAESDGLIQVLLRIRVSWLLSQARASLLFLKD